MFRINRKRVRFLLLFPLMIAILGGCGNHPPMPTLQVGQTKVHVELGTYSWRQLAQHVISDSAGPFYMIDMDQEAADVSPGSDLTIHFGNKPKVMHLKIWEGQNEISNVRLASQTVRLPAEKGDYLYSIRAEWKKGGGEYAFAIRVR